MKLPYLLLITSIGSGVIGYGVSQTLSSPEQTTTATANSDEQPNDDDYLSSDTFATTEESPQQDVVFTSGNSAKSGSLVLIGQNGFNVQEKTIDSGSKFSEDIFFDFDNDGDTDVVAIWSDPENTIVLFENDGNANFTQADQVISCDLVRSLNYDDFNNDGKTDLLVIRNSQEGHKVYFGQ